MVMRLISKGLIIVHVITVISGNKEVRSYGFKGRHFHSLELLGPSI